MTASVVVDPVPDTGSGVRATETPLPAVRCGLARPQAEHPKLARAGATKGSDDTGRRSALESEKPSMRAAPCFSASLWEQRP